MPRALADVPYVREYVCEICDEHYRSDFARKQGEPKRMVLGMCSECTHSVATFLEGMGMLTKGERSYLNQPYLGSTFYVCCPEKLGHRNRLIALRSYAYPKPNAGKSK